MTRLDALRALLARPDPPDLRTPAGHRRGVDPRARPARDGAVRTLADALARRDAVDRERRTG